MTKKGRSAMKTKNRNSRGFTLLEVLIAILIIGIIAATVVPLMGEWTQQAASTRLIANAVQLDKAVQRYEADHKAPWGWVYDPNDPELLKEVPGEDTSYLVAQLQMPTDVYGNVMGEPAGSVTGDVGYGPYVVRAFVPVPATLLLGVQPPIAPGHFMLDGQTESDGAYLTRFALHTNGRTILTKMSYAKEGKGIKTLVFDAISDQGKAFAAMEAQLGGVPGALKPEGPLGEISQNLAKLLKMKMPAEAYNKKKTAGEKKSFAIAAKGAGKEISKKYKGDVPYPRFKLATVTVIRKIGGGGERGEDVSCALQLAIVGSAPPRIAASDRGRRFKLPSWIRCGASMCAPHVLSN